MLWLLELTIFCCFYSIVKLRKRKSERFQLNESQKIRDGTNQDFLDSTGKFQNLRRLTGQSTGRLQKGFVLCSLHLMKSFQKGGGGKGEVLKFVTADGVSEKITQC